MAKKLHVVRIVTGPDCQLKLTTNLLEALRYMGYVKVVHDGYDVRCHPGILQTAKVVDFYPTKAGSNDSLGWAQRNSERLRTFGINAWAVESETPVKVYVLKDKEGKGWACCNGIEGYHFTILRTNALEVIGDKQAIWIAAVHYPHTPVELIQVFTA